MWQISDMWRILDFLLYSTQKCTVVADNDTVNKSTPRVHTSAKSHNKQMGKSDLFFCIQAVIQITLQNLMGSKLDKDPSSDFLRKV